MYCVIQEIETKKFNQYGSHKELASIETRITTSEGTFTRYSYGYGNERFHRPIRKAYKISIHESKRVNGVVTKKQYAVTTVNYYDFVEVDIVDCVMKNRVEKIAEALNVYIDDIWNTIADKTEPLEQRIRSEFERTEEYKTEKKHSMIIANYCKKRYEFIKQYECAPSEYEYCYDLYGELRNPEYLEKVKREYGYRKSYEEKSRSYQESFYRNYSSGSSSYTSYSKISSSTYSNNQDIFKKFYRTLSKAYHPDSNPDKDTSEEMKLLNQLKGEWGV